MTLKELGLRGNTITELREAHIQTAEELTGYSPQALLHLPGIGEKRLEEIQARLAEHGMSLATRT
jgi:DNA-directed RNA polymerase alpha subunit